MTNKIDTMSEEELLAAILEKLDVIAKKLPDGNKQLADTFQFIDNADLIRLLKINAKTAANWRKRGLIKAVKIGGKIFYSVPEIQKMMMEKFNRKLEG